MQKINEAEQAMASEEKEAPLLLFYSYAHEDQSLLEQLERHLHPLVRRGTIIDWYDQKIVAGKPWESEIEKYLDAASVILLLVSPDFLASDERYQREMQRALARHEEGEALVIPIILRPADWQGGPLGRLQSLPRNGKPITSWLSQDQAFFDVAQGIQEAVAKLQHRSQTQT
jgi:hypothetical protein